MIINTPLRILDKNPHTRGLCDIDRFFTKVEMTSYCWEWKGTASKRNQKAAPVARFKANGKWQFASRWVWSHLHGSIPDGMNVLHRCDNRLCVNPTHLFLGTQLDNIADMKRKGRARGVSRPGELSTSAKLKRDQVKQILLERESGSTLRSIATKFGVGVVQIWRITHHKRWEKAL